MKLIDGKKIAAQIEARIKKSKRTGGLAAILVGDDAPSQLYVRLKEKAAARVGIKFEKYLYPITNDELRMTNNKKLEKKLMDQIQTLNNRRDITGIIVQLPLPKNLNTNKIINAINPRKDVDGYHPQNLYTYLENQCSIPPAVFSAVLEILKSVKVATKNKKIVFVSNSKIFPIPFESCFAKDAAEFVICSLRSAKKYLPNADIILTAVGKKHYLKASLVKRGATIIDIGISRHNGQVFGDADAVSLNKKAAYLTPVPGGVGPVTIACLLKNTTRLNQADSS
jgi:methylenetetrahydrofolate dehydrogenase (NADP+)/methenyltetrahydrofolate cyclohydrolase